MAKDKYYAYDLEYSHILKEIKTPITIYSSRNTTEGKCLETEALWDTGATNSVLTPKISQKLGLISVDSWYVGGINNEKSSDIVIASIALPNGTFLNDWQFVVCDIPGADVLVGMDIISKGDFCISNARAKTLFSFVIPPYKEKISYSKLTTDNN